MSYQGDILMELRQSLRFIWEKLKQPCSLTFLILLSLVVTIASGCAWDTWVDEKVFGDDLAGGSGQKEGHQTDKTDFEGESQR